MQLVRSGVALAAGTGDGMASPRADGSAGEGLSDQWISFLIQQAEAEGTAEANSSDTGSGVQTGPGPNGSVSA